jgi:hypothetical protein
MAQIKQEMTDIMKGKDKSQRGIMLRRAGTALKLTMTEEQAISFLTKEYAKKYGALQTGKTNIQELKKDSLKQIEQAKKPLK